MNNDHDTERLFIGRCALMLFVGGLLIPFILVVLVLALGNPNLSSETKYTACGLSLGFGLVAGVLALIFGIIGRRYLSGKTALVGVIVWLGAWLLVGALGSVVLLIKAMPQKVAPIKGGTGPPGWTAKATEKASEGPPAIPKPGDK
jgi:ABC-type transport system involved in multi-copper enzyme maturation permease subunit